MNCWLLQLCSFLLCSVLVYAQNNADCGRPNEEIDRIVHGRDVGYMRYPWFATLLLKKMDDKLMCGGSLISPRHILTAAHCFKPFFKSVDAGTMTLEEIYDVKMGVNNICKEEGSQKMFTTSKIYIHEKYRANIPYYDIAIVELDRVANFTPICLPNSLYTDYNRTVDGLIVGLGKESSHAWTLPCTVKEARVLVYNDTTCIKMLQSMEEDTSKFTGAFCAGYLEGGIDSCQGDSGGPFQAINSNNRYELDGITSFGFGCAAKDVLGIYTDVSHYLDWIHEKINLDTALKQETSALVDSYPIGDLAIPEPISTTTPPADIPTVQQVKHRKPKKHGSSFLSNLLASLNLGGLI